MNEALQFLTERGVTVVAGGYLKIPENHWPKKAEWDAIELLTTKYGFDVLPYKDAARSGWPQEPMAG